MGVTAKEKILGCGTSKLSGVEVIFHGVDRFIGVQDR